MNKFLHSIIVFFVFIFLGFIASLINDFVWFIIVFALFLGYGGGKIYDLLIMKFGYKKNDKIIIYSTIIISAMLFFFTINLFDYYQAKTKMEEIIKKENTNSLNNIKDIIKNAYNEQINIYKNEIIKNILIGLSTKEKRSNRNLINNINKNIENNEVEKMFINFNKLIKNIGIKDDAEGMSFTITKLLEMKKQIDNNNYSLAFDKYLEIINLIEKDTGNIILDKETINLTKSSLSNNSITMDSVLKGTTGFDGLLGFWINSIKYGGKIESHGNTTDLGSFGGVGIFIADFIAIIFGAISMISLFTVKICEIHNKQFKQFGKNFLFATRIANFDKIQLIDILKEKIFKVPEKTSFFTVKSIFYGNITFLKCPDCELGNNTIQLLIEFYGASKKRPISGIKKYYFDISYEDYGKINQFLENLKEENIS